MQMGAGIFNYIWLANKNCICVGRNNYVNDSILIHTYHDFIFRENRVFTTYVNPKYIDQESLISDKKQFIFKKEYLLLYILRDLIILEKNNFTLSQFENFQKYNIYQDWSIEIDINSLLNNDVITNYNIIKNVIYS